MLCYILVSMIELCIFMRIEVGGVNLPPHNASDASENLGESLDGIVKVVRAKSCLEEVILGYADIALLVAPEQKGICSVGYTDVGIMA